MKNLLQQFNAILNEGIGHQDLADTLISRLQYRYPDIIDRYGYDAVENAVDEVASLHAGAEELGSSDVGIMLKQIIKSLENSAVDEGAYRTRRYVDPDGPEPERIEMPRHIPSQDEIEAEKEFKARKRAELDSTMKWMFPSKKEVGEEMNINEDSPLGAMGFSNAFINKVYRDYNIAHTELPEPMTKKPTVAELDKFVFLSKTNSGKAFAVGKGSKNWSGNAPAWITIDNGDGTIKDMRLTPSKALAQVAKGQYFAIPYSGWDRIRGQGGTEYKRKHPNTGREMDPQDATYAYMQKVQQIYGHRIRSEMEKVVDFVYANMRKFGQQRNSNISGTSPQERVLAIANKLEAAAKDENLFSSRPGNWDRPSFYEQYLRSLEKLSHGYASIPTNYYNFVEAMDETPAGLAKFAKFILSTIHAYEKQVKDLLYKDTVDALKGDDVRAEVAEDVIQLPKWEIGLTVLVKHLNQKGVITSLGKDNAIVNVGDRQYRVPLSGLKRFPIKSVVEDSDPCWDNYKQIGMKMKGGKKVPNCVPKEGVEEGVDAEAYKKKLLATLPQMMHFYEKNVQDWKPSKEQMLAAVETGYTIMKHTGDVNQAGKAVMDELNTLHRMSQGQKGVAEGTGLSNEFLGKYKTAAAADASKADKEGDFKRGDKRFSGIIKATKKQFDNDAKQQAKESAIMKGLKNVK